MWRIVQASQHVYLTFICNRCEVDKENLKRETRQLSACITHWLNQRGIVQTVHPLGGEERADTVNVLVIEIRSVTSRAAGFFRCGSLDRFLG